ncbi:MAG: hypothetical protein UT32_C0002G0085 [Parcubacteria group bacterium GW2011_GWC2_39_14]|nr:MAG: hypothetical protein UT32_C0002G0085 [Parcubacteria group bacterium GW2011_GWC2_39_14]KKR55310.1 MAG: hypothetical protein UT91_C0003G0085 [Parcubacteria group bacterium GW2011_GWA2_40_23]
MTHEQFLSLIGLFSRYPRARVSSVFIARTMFEEFLGQKGRLMALGISDALTDEIVSLTVEWDTKKVEIICLRAANWSFKLEGNMVRLERDAKATADPRETFPSGINCYEITFWL